VREVRFAPDGPLPPLPGKSVGVRVVLRGDEEVRGVLLAADADGLEVKPPDLPAVRLRFDLVRRIETERPGRTLCDEPARFSPPRAGTVVAYATSGDAFPGTLDRASLGRPRPRRRQAHDRVGRPRRVTVDSLPPRRRPDREPTPSASRLAADSIEGDRTLG
jgi:hypothetical protein